MDREELIARITDLYAAIGDTAPDIWLNALSDYDLLMVFDSLTFASIMTEPVPSLL